MTDKYSWEKGRFAYLVIFTEGEQQTIIARTDTAEQAHFITAAANGFSGSDIKIQWTAHLQEIADLKNRLKILYESAARTDEKQAKEIERLKGLTKELLSGWFISFYRATSTMTAREIDDYFKEQWDKYAKENGLTNK